MSFWANTHMAEDESEGLDGSVPDAALQDHIAHWVEVLDRWVKRIDTGLGRQDGAATTSNGDGELLQMDDGGDLAKGVEGSEGLDS
jgi:hypothetical protein